MKINESIMIMIIWEIWSKWYLDAAEVGEKTLFFFGGFGRFVHPRPEVGDFRAEFVQLLQRGRHLAQELFRLIGGAVEATLQLAAFRLQRFDLGAG